MFPSLLYVFSFFYDPPSPFSVLHMCMDGNPSTEHGQPTSSQIPKEKIFAPPPAALTDNSISATGIGSHEQLLILISICSLYIIMAFIMTSTSMYIMYLTIFTHTPLLTFLGPLQFLLTPSSPQVASPLLFVSTHMYV